MGFIRYSVHLQKLNFAVGTLNNFAYFYRQILHSSSCSVQVVEQDNNKEVKVKGLRKGKVLNMTGVLDRLQARVMRNAVAEREEVANLEALKNFADAVVSDKRFTVIIDNTLDKNCKMKRKSIKTRGKLTEAVVFEWKFAEINKLMIGNIEYFLDRYGAIHLPGMEKRCKISNATYTTPFGEVKAKKVQYMLYCTN